MANTRSIGNAYWHVLIYPIKPKVVFDKAETQEIAGKFRWGKGWAVRLPLTRCAIVVGIWKQAFPESVALTRAINGRMIEESSFDWDTIRQKEILDDI